MNDDVLFKNAVSLIDRSISRERERKRECVQFTKQVIPKNGTHLFGLHVFVSVCFGKNVPNRRIYPSSRNIFDVQPARAIASHHRQPFIDDRRGAIGSVWQLSLLVVGERYDAQQRCRPWFACHRRGHSILFASSSQSKINCKNLGRCVSCMHNEDVWGRQSLSLSLFLTSITRPSPSIPTMIARRGWWLLSLCMREHQPTNSRHFSE